MTLRPQHRWNLTYTLVLLGLLFLSRAPLTAARPGAPVGAPSVVVDAAGVTIEWQLDHNASDPFTAPGWQELIIAGVRVPAWLVVVTSEAELPDPAITIALKRPWAALSAVEPPVPQTSAGELHPALTPPQEVGPAAPVTILRSARLGGRIVSVVALSPLFVGPDGGAQLAVAGSATLPGATTDTPALSGTPLPFATPAPDPAPPTNPDLAGPAWRIVVSAGGIQELRGADLAAAGADLAALPPARLRLRRAGAEVALEISGAADSRLDTGDTLRFYAPAPGDRWNATDTYWLSIGDGAGMRMDVRQVSPGGAPARATAIERGAWRQPRIYDSTLPGPAGEHWFSADLRSGPGLPDASLTIPLTPTLPLAPGALRLTLSGAAYTGGDHELVVAAGAANASIRWSGSGTWSYSAALATQAANVELRMPSGAAPAGLLLDTVAWERPVALRFGAPGAAFFGVGGTWHYQIAGVAAGQALYDISDPLRPARLSGWSSGFEDGPTARSYLLTGSATLLHPQVLAYTPTPLPTASDAIYIAPAELHAALAPLLDHRRRQGLHVAAIDLQPIYDRWSFGQVAPEAIRSFLRHSVATSSPALGAVILVGDGSADPRNYSARNTPNLIPPYLAEVDPWLGETACETCFAQLDGADPLADLLPDLAIGRLPVKSAPELEALVAKLVGYDTQAGGLDWRSRQIYLSDNSYAADGTPDPAGDFAAQSDALAAQQPAGVHIQRIYYDPWGRDATGTPLRNAAHIADAPAARATALSAMNAGAGVVIYTGHSNQWQWAVTDPGDPQGYLLTLYDPDDLHNAVQLPVVLALTCLSSAFQTPAYSGTVIDERLLLSAAGGAVAVWGSTGLGVSYGHEPLARGFFQQRWGSGAATSTLGELTMAGYRELFLHGTCCHDVLRTFALLGDPLTPARMLAAHRTLLPLVSHP